MNNGNLRLRIPNPHKSDISKTLVSELLKQANIPQEEWEKIK